MFKVLNTLYTICIVLILCVAGLYSGYALWDNHQVYTEAGDVQADLLKFKPPALAEGDNSPGFDELRAINPDVCAWLTMDNTAIDHPVLYGENNLTYINKDVYGNFALAGSIFMDSRNARDFSDAYTLIYGHHMSEHRMFGDLALYEEAAFFRENTTGMLITPQRTYRLTVLACLQVGASEPNIFEPDTLRETPDAVLTFAEQNALQLHREMLEQTTQELGRSDTPRLLALSTCSSDFTDARTIVLTRMDPYRG